MSTAALPGFASPAVGFDQPFEMLHACHDRVERTLSLLARLVAHVRDHGHCEDSRSAARDVLRYFDLAAPHHHQDEERHVLPPLLASKDAAQRALAEQLIADHRRMEMLWAVVRGPLQQWAEAQPTATATAFAQPQALAEFTALYADHIAREEGRAYPLVLAVLDTATLAAMGAEMAARRRPGRCGMMPT
ncbi:hemerythrin domain-containing protein [Sphaerotilus sp.]|uniref:hemerythrin domain-containing protein n=1 Tax=Sphaerotilus sp. TaxID=2093942 RepID=UPI002ACE2E59|nr:hemerythrin domain-containing protein [Sphaerotilus sp.]MDZ7858190.1 hemerythrin domain-containing protein [Sphaerotilus sp.]